MLLALLCIASNAFANLPGPPWLDFGNIFTWDGTTIGSSASQPTVTTITYKDRGTVSSMHNATSDSIYPNVVGFSLSFDGNNTNDTISIGSFFSADLVVGAVFDPTANGTWELQLANIVTDATGGGAHVADPSRWVQEFAMLSNQHLIFNVIGSSGSIINATGKLVPEPGVLFMLGTGLIGLLMIARRKETFQGTAI